MNSLNRMKMLITEAYRFNDGEDVCNAIINKQIGVKISPIVIEMVNKNRALSEREFSKIINSALTAKQDVAFCIQTVVKVLNKEETAAWALSSLGRINDNIDALTTYAKYHKSEWAKNIPGYMDFDNTSYNPDKWHKLEKALQEEALNHGNKKKGSGIKNSACEKYNDGNWSLEVPGSFEEEQAIAFYYEDGKKTPTHWCTRADRGYYNSYTQNGKTHLYVIKNLKTGRAYQLAFMGDSVEFLDDQDEKGDEITNGDLRKIPDSLLKLVKDENVRNGRTLYDFKNAKIVRGEISNSKHFMYASEASRGITDGVKWGTPKQIEGDYYQKTALNHTNDYPEDTLSHYFDSKNVDEYYEKADEVSDEIIKKSYMVAFYNKNYPNAIEAWEPATGTIFQRGFDKVPKEVGDKIDSYLDALSSKANKRYRIRDNENREKDWQKQYDQNQFDYAVEDIFKKYDINFDNVARTYIYTDKGTKLGSINSGNIKASTLGLIPAEINTDEERIIFFDDDHFKLPFSKASKVKTQAGNGPVHIYTKDSKEGKKYFDAAKEIASAALECFSTNRNDLKKDRAESYKRHKGENLPNVYESTYFGY